MSEKLTFWKKVRLFRWYLKEQKNGVIISCPYCKGTNIHFTSQVERKYGREVTYRSIYLCNDCYAACDNTQEWVRIVE